MNTTTQNEFARLSEGQPGPRQVALVSGLDVPLFRLDLPGGLRGQAREQVARRQLVDRLGLLADQVDMRPFATGPKADLWDRVLITAPEHLEDWRSLNCRAVLPDYLCLPCAEGVWTLVAASHSDRPTIMARLGVADGFTATPLLLAPMLDSALKELDRPRAIYHPGTLMPQVAQWAGAQDIPLVTDISELAQMNLPTPRVLAHAELSCDLRRDPQAARAQLAARVLPWRWPVLAAGLAAALWSAGQIVSIGRINDETAGVSAGTTALVQQHFVQSGPVLDVRIQVSRALAELRSEASGSEGGQSDPVELGWRVAEVVTAEDATPEVMIWNTQSGLTLALRVADFAAADRIATAMVGAGLDATLVDSRASADAQGVRAEYRIAHGEATQ